MPSIEVFIDIDMAQFGQRVQQARLALVPPVRQYQLDWRCDFGRGQVNRIEQGRVPGLRLVTAANLAQALSVSLDWLCGLGETLPGQVVDDARPTSRAPHVGDAP